MIQWKYRVLSVMESLNRAARMEVSANTLPLIRAAFDSRGTNDIMAEMQFVPATRSISKAQNRMTKVLFSQPVLSF